MKLSIAAFLLLTSPIHAFVIQQQKPRIKTELYNDKKAANVLDKSHKKSTKFDDSLSQDEEFQKLTIEYQNYSLNKLKDVLTTKHKLRRVKGRKADLAAKLAHLELYGTQQSEAVEVISDYIAPNSTVSPPVNVNNQFEKFNLPVDITDSLASMNIYEPTPIQRAALESNNLSRNTSKTARFVQHSLLHAPTGSGKTLAYLLPALARFRSRRSAPVTLVLTPTRELAAQVAAVAAQLVKDPKKRIRLVSQPTNLMDGGAQERLGGYNVIIGSAKTICVSLFGDDVTPAPHTPKPLAGEFCGSVHTLILDEVDRLLLQNTKKIKHAKPAARVCQGITKATRGDVSCVAASATVGRPIRRELCKVLGLNAKDGSLQVVRGSEEEDEEDEAEEVSVVNQLQQQEQVKQVRAVKIPSTVTNYYLLDKSKESTVGSLLTTATSLIQRLSNYEQRRILLVLSKNYQLSALNVLGALKHFKMKPVPSLLVDYLESGEHLNYQNSSKKGQLLITNEDSVRGMHIDDLDTVIVLGKPVSVDEYTHVAGRTGRAGKSGNVITVTNDFGNINQWESMLDIDFHPLKLDDVSDNVHYDDDNNNETTGTRTTVAKDVSSNKPAHIAEENEDVGDLTKKAVADLKELLRSKNLPVSGNKAELIARLESQ